MAFGGPSALSRSFNTDHHGPPRWRRWYPFAGRFDGEAPVGFSAVDCAADDEVMASPAMIAARTIGWKSAPEIAGGESSRAIGWNDAGLGQLLHSALESQHRFAYLTQQVGVRAG